MGSVPLVRDPLLALGCKDPVDRISELKINDPKRQETVAFFMLWFDKHGEHWVKASDLDLQVRILANMREKGDNWQAVTAYIDNRVGSRLAGLVLERQKTAKHTPAFYRVVGARGI